ncbi:MAG: hypothetical protein ACRCYU_06320 [Nocardioides sp.]
MTVVAQIIGWWLVTAVVLGALWVAYRMLVDRIGAGRRQAPGPQSLSGDLADEAEPMITPCQGQEDLAG